MLIRCDDSPQLSPLTLLCNTGAGGVFSNVRENLKKGYRKFAEIKAHNRVIALSGSGPSLGDTLENIRAMQKRGAFILAMNGTGRFLYENGIKPDALAMVDPREENADFLQKAWAPEAWLASQCHPKVFEQAEKIGMKVVLWHPGVPEIQNHIPSKDSLRMGGGYTIGMCAMSCAYVAGFREMHLFGFDSSNREKKTHAFEQPMNVGYDEMVTAVVDNRIFECSVTMAAQASLFLDFTQHLLKDGVELHVHGDGLIPTLWAVEQRKKGLRILNAAYDLGLSPPTYDFISFLIEAERHRVKNNFDVIDLSFQPGPMNGFRSDQLPPDLKTRDGMLWRVCAGIARLLPSVRNIQVLKERAPVTGHVFPDGWGDMSPVSHYGTKYLRGGEPMLCASDYARALTGTKYPHPYATITLRESSYWPQRNSNLDAWYEVARWLIGNGIETVFVPDAESEKPPHGISYAIDATYDVDLRAALYEGAVINLGVANGPMYLCPYLNARYLIFNINVESVHSSSKEFLLSHGVTSGDETVFGGNGKVIWEPDSAEAIIRQLQEFNVQSMEKTS